MRAFTRFVVAVVVAGIVAALSTMGVASQFDRLFSEAVTGTEGDPINLRPLAARSVVYARDGTVLTVLHDEENRQPVTLDRVPEHVIRAVLDAEDDRFFEHGALDARALTRALVTNIESGGVYEGGSTITQQLVKITLLNPSQRADRKVKEAVLATRLEKALTKQQILERYINTVYLGNHAYGLQAGAETYFRTDLDKLDVGQAILLASLIRDPVGSDPWVDPTAARERRGKVVDRMRDLGHVTPEDVDRIKGEPLPTPPPPDPAKGSDYFAEYVKQQLLADPRLGDTAAERIQAVFGGGLAIHTTLDPGFQRSAEDAVAGILPDSAGQFSAALVSVEPTTGAVRALVGGPDFDRSKFNLATDGLGRQPGSSFKPFALMAALEQGFSVYDSILASSPCVIPNPGGPVWQPGNVEGSAGGVLTLTEATVKSVNCAYARLVKMIGPESVADVAHRMGITSEIPPYLSITLGSSLVTPMQMASAFSTLAADGVRRAPYGIERVVDAQGKELFAAEHKGEQVVSQQNARSVTQVLSQGVQRGTGTAAAVPPWTVAGKTGTTDNHTNAWFVGYTPTLSTAVWMGNPEGDVPMTNVGGIRVYGGTYPARIFRAYMSAALAGMEPVSFPAPQASGGSASRGERRSAPSGPRLQAAAPRVATPLPDAVEPPAVDPVDVYEPPVEVEPDLVDSVEFDFADQIRYRVRDRRRP